MAQDVSARGRSRRTSTPLQAALWLLCALLLPAAFVVQHLTGAPDRVDVVAESLPLVRVSASLTFVWFLLAWALPSAPRWRPAALAATALLGVELAVPVLLLTGAPPVTAVREVVATTVQAVMALLWYRLRSEHGASPPERPRELLALLQGFALGSLVGGLVATEPGVPSLVWALQGLAGGFVGAACVLVVVHRRPGEDLRATRPRDVAGLVGLLVVACAAQVLLPTAPLTWLVLVPAVVAGLVLPPWPAALFTLTASIGVSALQVLGVRSGASSVPDAWSTAALLTAFAGVALALSLDRDDRNRLTAEVTRRRQAALDQAGLLQTLLESISDALLLVDRDGVVQLHNGAASELLDPQQLRTEPRLWLAHGELPARFTHTVDGDPGEAPRVLSVHLAPVQYAGAEGVVAVVRDVTSEHQRLEELASFAAVAAHELKAPLTAVQGWLDVAEESVADPEARDLDRATHALGRGQNAAVRMAAAIDEWLTYSVAREGRIAPEPVPLAPLLADLASTHHDADLRLRADDVVLADPTLLRHLFGNLVGNAVKYTRPGERPEVTVRSAAERPGWVAVEVTDRGIGIPAGEEATVFEPFRRASGAATSYEGTGLGLALCRRIVRRHGGTIGARRNDDGPGTTISVTLPAPRTPTEDS